MVGLGGWRWARHVICRLVTWAFFVVGEMVTWAFEPSISSCFFFNAKTQVQVEALYLLGRSRVNIPLGLLHSCRKRNLSKTKRQILVNCQIKGYFKLL